MDTPDAVKGLSSKKVYGIPVIWIVLIVAAAGLYGAFRLKPAPSDTADATDVPEGDNSADTGQPVFTANPVTIAPIESNPDNTDSNDKWARRSIEWLSANGATLSLATSAISKYINSEDLSFAEGALRDKAVKQFGLPPEGLSQSNTLGYQGPAVKQGNPPTTHTVKGKSDDTFSELGRLYYGLSNWDAANLLRRANLTIVEPFPVGARITIPPYHDPTYYVATGATHTLYAIAAKNSTTAAKVQALNPGKTFPVKVGTRVRVS